MSVEFPTNFQKNEEENCVDIEKIKTDIEKIRVKSEEIDDTQGSFHAGMEMFSVAEIITSRTENSLDSMDKDDIIILNNIIDALYVDTIKYLENSDEAYEVTSQETIARCYLRIGSLDNARSTFINASTLARKNGKIKIADRLLNKGNSIEA
ncbi:MAG: hypothetical protein PF572_02650 [Patescibacteria group bacterium]|jgi:hypothetical protein|nr:hypothetical protein [Patescibacteria group bacterium]